MRSVSSSSSSEVVFHSARSTSSSTSINCSASGTMFCKKTCHIRSVMLHSKRHVTFEASCHTRSVMSHSKRHVTLEASCHIMSHSKRHVTFEASCHTRSVMPHSKRHVQCITRVLVRAYSSCSQNVPRGAAASDVWCVVWPACGLLV